MPSKGDSDLHRKTWHQFTFLCPLGLAGSASEKCTVVHALRRPWFLLDHSGVPHVTPHPSR